MRVTLATLGSRGDIQPMVVLGAELRRRGHEVVLGVPPNLIDFAGKAGFRAHPVGPDSQAFVESADGQRWLASGDARAFLNAMGEIGHEMAPQADSQLLRACEGAELIVCGILGEDHALCVAEAWGIPLVSLHLAPSRPTRAYPNFLVTTRQLHLGVVNRATGSLVERVVWNKLRGDTNALRARLGLAASRRTTTARMADMGVPEVQGYSTALAPRLHDYGARRPITGFLTPDAELRRQLGEQGVDADLDAWLDAGDAPAYFGFGSMPILDPPAALATINAVARRLGVRALISAGWSGIAGESSDDVRVVGAINHDAVLPRCLLAVHHGGAGTTAAAATAGIPALVYSVFADQPFWGARLEELGCGVHHRFTDLSPETLESSLRRLLDPELRRRAATLGRVLAADGGGAQRAADVVEAAYDAPGGRCRPISSTTRSAMVASSAMSSELKRWGSVPSTHRAPSTSP